MNDAKITPTATVKTAREINRQVLLNLIRRHQPISRADLARRSCLQPSTVSTITGQLIAERWVTLGMVGDLPRGRKPTFLHFNGNRAAVLAVDIQPAETTIAVADLSLKFLAQETLPTNHNPKQFIPELGRRISRTIKSLPSLAFEGIGVVLPGRVDLASGRVAFAPFLGWKSLDLRNPLEQATGLSVKLDNVANACALAEYWRGAHSNEVSHLVAVAIGECISVGMILNEQLVRGGNGLAGEFGHVTIHENGPQCYCGNRGCLDACASNLAAVRYFMELTAGNQRVTPPAFGTLLDLVEQGNQVASQALERMAQYLGAGLAILIAGLSPDVIVLVGDVTRAWPRISPFIHETLRQRLTTPWRTQILPADPHTQPRLLGAGALVLQEHFALPRIL